jgi:hypothetical protein
MRGHKSDNNGTHMDSLRVSTDFLSGFHSQEPLTSARFTARLEARGLERYTTQSRLCACGQPALRVWKLAGYCKRCLPPELRVTRT